MTKLPMINQDNYRLYNIVRFLKDGLDFYYIVFPILCCERDNLLFDYLISERKKDLVLVEPLVSLDQLPLANNIIADQYSLVEKRIMGHQHYSNKLISIEHAVTKEVILAAKMIKSPEIRAVLTSLAPELQARCDHLLDFFNNNVDNKRSQHH